MKSHYVESIPSVKKLSDIINNPGERALPSRIKTEIINVLEGAEKLEGEVKSLLGIFPAACGVIWRNEQIYT